MRLPPLAHDTLGPDARELLDEVVNGRRSSVNTARDPEDSLGPYGVMLHSPIIGRRFAALGEAIRFDGVLDVRLRELATVVVGAHWQAEYEWAVHARLARKAGIEDAVLDAVARGDDPQLDDPQEASVYRFTRALLQHGHVPEAAYREAVGELGEESVIELTVIAGFYTLISFTLNAFEVPPPAGDAPIWPRPPEHPASA